MVRSTSPDSLIPEFRGQYSVENMKKSARHSVEQVTVILVLTVLVIGFTTNVYASDAAPGLVILAPGGALNSSTVIGTSFVLAFAVSNFQLVPPGLPGQTNQPNQGHIHVFLDGVYYNLWAIPEGIPFNNVQPGQHTIKLELVNSDHTPLNPDVSASTTLQVTSAPQGPPSLTILSPAGALNSATNVSPSFVVSFAINNFTFTDPIGQPKALNTGHMHIFLDDVYYGLWTSMNPIPFIGLNSGSHTIKLQLVNNDHTPLSPDLSQTISVTVSGASSSLSTSPSSGSIAGFPVEAVLAGAVIWIGILVLVARKQKVKQ